MSDSLISLDFAQVRETVGGLSQEQVGLEADLTESLAALEAYQSHLEAWQRQLSQEREAWENEQATRKADEASIHAADQVEIARLLKQLSAGKERISSLENDLLACNEELRESEERRIEVISQLDAARTREKLLTSSSQKGNAAAIANKKKVDALRKQDADQSGHGDHTSHSSDPVLTSVVAQFDKIRKQLAFGREQHDGSNS